MSQVLNLIISQNTNEVLSMIMLIMTIILMAATFVAISVFTARYCFKFLARRYYNVGELSDEFRAKFASQLAQCSLPCKRFISSKFSQTLQGFDNRPIIYAAGEIYINEDICKHFSPEGFAAGLAYEQAHYDSGFYMYSELIMFIIFAGCIPAFAVLNGILQSLAAYHPWIIISMLAYVINLLHVWPLLQFIPVLGCVIFLEFALGASVVNFYANKGYDLKSLLRYLKYVESYVSVGVNQTFNITSNRKRCEKLLEDL